MPCETCCHMWALHIVITTVMQSVSKYLYVHFGFVRYTLVSYSFIPSMRLIRDLSSAGPSQECECSITGRVPAWWSSAWWGLKVSWASPAPLPAGAVMLTVASYRWASLPLGVGQGPASGHTTALWGFKMHALLSHNVLQPVCIQSDGPRLSDERKEESWGFIYIGVRPYLSHPFFRVTFLSLDFILQTLSNKIYSISGSCCKVHIFTSLECVCVVWQKFALFEWSNSVTNCMFFFNFI